MFRAPLQRFSLRAFPDWNESFNDLALLERRLIDRKT
jgi:hypothetical protein